MSTKRELEKEQARVRMRKLRADPTYLAMERDRARERRGDPAYRARNQDRELERERERWRERRANPIFRARERELARERYRTNPMYAANAKKRYQKRVLERDVTEAQSWEWIRQVMAEDRG